MQNLINCPNRRLADSAKLLNFLFKKGTGRRAFCGARSPCVRLNSKRNGLLTPALPNTYREVRDDLRTLHTLVLKIGLDKRYDLPRFLNARAFSTTSANRKDEKESNKKSTDREDGSKNDSDNDPEKNNNAEIKLIFQKIFFITMFMVGAVAVIQEAIGNKDTKSNTVSWNEFVYQMLAKGEVKEITVEPHIKRVTIILHDGAIVNGKRSSSRVLLLNLNRVDNFEEKVRKVEEELNIKFDDRVPITYDRRNEFLDNLSMLVLLTLCTGFIIFQIFKHSSKFKFDFTSHLKQAKFTLVEPFTSKGVRFKDVAGLKEAKIEVMEFVDYLKNPERYKTLGAKVPRGALLLGPPGCGKTLLAKAVATESNVPFLSMNGSEFIEMLGGLGAARVRDLFKEARRRAPSIIYIDEIDAIGKQRSEEAVEFGNGESERTLNQLLVEMDGMTSQEGVIILASTNRSEVLDKALLRPGRFDRHILIDLPNLEERKQIFENHLQALLLADEPSKYSGYMAYLTPGFSGADIANVCNEAALHAARDRKKQVEGSDLLYAIDRTIGGITKKSTSITPTVKKVVAYHEAGHALVGWLLEHTDALLKVTIVPRTNMSLGFAQYTESDTKLHSKEELFQRMCMMLGGRVAESITFNDISTGAENDLQKVTKVAYHQVQQFGMSSNVGLLSWSEEFTGTQTKKPYSKKLGNLMDLEARRIIAEAYRTTEKLLMDNKDKLAVIAEALLEKETLTYEEVEKLIGPPPFGKKRLIEPAEFEKIISEAESRSPEPSPA